MAPSLVSPGEVTLRYGVHDQKGYPRYLITALGCGMCFTTQPIRPVLDLSNVAEQNPA